MTDPGARAESGFTDLPGLRLRVLLPSALLLGALLLVLGLLGAHWLDSENQRQARARADGMARALSLLVDGAAGQASQGAAGSETSEALLRRALDSEPLLVFARIEGPSLQGRPVLVTRGDDEGARLLREPQMLERALTTVPTGGARTVTGVPMALSRARLASGSLTLGVSLPRQQAETQGGVLSLVAALGAVLLAYGMALLVLLGSFSRRVELLAVGAQRVADGDLRTRVGGGGDDALGAVLLAYGMALLVLLGSFSRRVELLAAGAQRVADGDLRTRVGGGGDDALGVVGRAIDTTTERLSSAQGQIRGALTELGRSARDVAEAADQIRRGTAGQVSDIDEATQAARDLIQAQAGAVRQSESLRDETRLTAGVAQRVATVSQETATNVEDAERLATATSEAARQMYASVVDIARQTGQLTESTAQTAGAMQDVRHAMTRVRETATSAAALAEHASLDAERGALVLEGSMAGIEAIREASRAIGGVTDGLQLRVGEIGNVLHLITELTQRTNLLALNASIIAAQAGAEGRGFAVVADEIKDLARRTANSAGNIDSLIQAVAEGAHAARRTALAGNEAVEAGATQAREAARTLTDILSRLRTWAGQAKSIASATDEQARSAGQVLRSLQDLQSQTAEIAGKATEQSRRGEFLQRHATRLAEVVESLGTASQELREGAAQVADTLTRMARTVEDLSGSQRSRVTEGERVRGMLEIARRIASGHRDAVATLERAVADLKGLAESIGEELHDPR